MNEERRCLDFCVGDVVAVEDEITILGFSLKEDREVDDSCDERDRVGLMGLELLKEGEVGGC